MSKAILIMDMPENCAECEICSNDGICMKANKFCSNRYETKQDWCPLKPLPEKKEFKETDPKKERLVESDEDCADCLCRVCARNSCNDSYNSQLEEGYANCSCNCNIGDKLIETEDDCPQFLPDED